MRQEEIKYWELVRKQQEGNLQNHESATLKAWSDQHPERYKEMQEIFSLSVPNEDPKFDPAETWNETKTMIRIEDEQNSGAARRIFPWIARAAAALLILVGVIYIYKFQSTGSDEMVMQNVVSTQGEMPRQLELPDGTVVWLNKDSELLYPEQFDLDSREIYLKGEAYFDVAHDAGKPFIVNAGLSKTTVLGTSFNLRAYSKEDDIRLTVVSGKVAFTLADEREQVVVTPGNMAFLQRSSMRLSTDKNLDLNFLSWKTNVLRFDDCPLSEIALALEKHYNMKIKVSDEATNNCRFTGDFSNTELENVLKIITSAIGTTYQKQDSEYVIAGKGCQ